MRTRIERWVQAGDGTRLYARETRGPDARGVPMVCANGIGVGTFFWCYVEERYSPERPVIAFDYRGHGRSEFPRDLDDLSVESCAEDLLRVLDSFGYERAILLGHSMGCQTIYTAAHLAPERVAGLVPMLGTFGRPVHTFLDRETLSLASFIVSHKVGLAVPDRIGELKARLIQSSRGRRFVSWLARRAGLCHPTLMPEKDLDAYLDHFAALSPVVFLRLAEKMAFHTAEPWLPRITAPTLVVAGELDIFTPLWLSEEAADKLQNAKLLVLRDASHAALVEYPERIAAELDRFLDEFRLAALPLERRGGNGAGPAPRREPSPSSEGQVEPALA